MSFEIGKRYTFKESEFEKSRESGKLVFKVSDPASTKSYIIKPFEYQLTDIPEKIVCVYKGNDRLEQDLDAVVPELYEVGKEYRFRVMRQDNNVQRNVSIRDDARGLTFYPVSLGKVRFERFQRITCQVVSTDKGKLKLKLVKDEQEKDKSKFSVEKLLGLRGARSLGGRALLKKLLDNPMFDEARLKFDADNPLWILIGLEAVTHSISLWLPRGRGYRIGVLRQVRELALSLIEHSDYLNVFPSYERRGLQGRLSAVILDCDDYLRAASLIAGGQDVEFITETLTSLKTTGWLYKPENKMRLLMALFTLKNSYVHDYIWEIFNIIRDHHSDRRFLDEFSEGFILMLRIFIDNETNFVNTTDRDSLRALIEALAIELLLTRTRQFSRWNFYRGRLYTLTMLLIGNPGTALAEKALLALTENLDMPLEYGWKDLYDVNRLCHVNLSGFPAPQDSANKLLSAFEAQNGRLAVENGLMNVTPALTGAASREVLRFPLVAEMAFAVALNGKFDARTAFEGNDLSALHVMWRDLEKSLLDPDQEVAAAATDVRIPVRKQAPAVDDEVRFRVEGVEEGDIYTFRCVIEDPVYEGKGIINTRDIVLFPVKAYPDTFWTETGQMLFRGRVIGLLPDGRVRLSLDKEVDEEIMRIAKNDLAEEAQIEAVVTKDNGSSCLAVTDGGYPVVIYKNGEDIRQSAKVFVTINDVSWNKKSDRPFIIARYEGSVEDSNPVQNYTDVRKAFHFILGEVSGGAVWIPAPQTAESDAESVEEAGGEVIPDIYLSAESVSGLSRLFDAMAYVTTDNLPRAYSLLSAARLLALLTGDTFRAQFLELKQALVEELSRFAIDGRVSATAVGELERRVELFPGNDMDLARRMEILKVLLALDKPSVGEGALLPDPTDSSMIGSLRRMVVSYNMLRGLKLNDVRRNLKLAVYGILNLPVPDFDVSRVNASEDQHHEFKESLVYPAGNNMLADERKQGLEIAQVICGMLNSEGGTLYIGVDNTGVPRGLVGDFVYLNNGFEEYDLEDVKDKFSLKFCKVLREHLGLTVEGTQIYPTLVTLEFDDIDDHCFAVVTVRPYRGVVRLTDGSVFIRQDSSTLPVKKKTEQAELEAVRRHLPVSLGR